MSKKNTGITLIALVITIIVLFILAGISIAMLTGENGIVKKAETAQEETKKSQYKEGLELIYNELKPEQIMEELKVKEFMDRYQEKLSKEISQNNLWKNANQERKKEEEIWVTTSEGWIYKITEKEINYLSNREDSPIPPDLMEGDIEFTYTPKGLTKENVKVEVESKIQGYILQYSTDGNTWENYDIASGIIMNKNGAIHVRLKNNLEETGATATANVTWIDKLPPNHFTPSTTNTENSITLTGSTTDQAQTSEYASSGIAKYYFSINNGATWLPSGGQAGNSYTFSGLSMGTTYQLKMKAVDNVGNEIITNTVSKTITKSISSVKEKDYVYYVDKNGTRRKCIVLYGPNSGKGIQIITEENISQIVLGSTSLEESIASYNSALKQLYDTAQTYLNTNLASSARCVGSRADITYFYENSGYNDSVYFSQYKGKLKNADDFYKSDYNQMKNLDLLSNVGDVGFWLASRFIWGNGYSTSYAGIMAWGKHMLNDFNQYRSFCMFWFYSSSNVRGFTCEAGFRPVFTLKSNVKILVGNGTSNSPYVLGI